MFVMSQRREDGDEGRRLVSLLSGVVAPAEEAQISRVRLTELQKDKIGIFWPCWVLVIPLLVCVLRRNNANVKTSNVVF